MPTTNTVVSQIAQLKGGEAGQEERSGTRCQNPLAGHEERRHRRARSGLRPRIRGGAVICMKQEGVGDVQKLWLFAGEAAFDRFMRGQQLLL